MTLTLGHIYMYIQLHAASVPPCCTGRSTDPSIYSLSDWVQLRVFGWLVLAPSGVILGSTLEHLVFLGSVLVAMGSLGAVRGGRVEKVTKKVVCWSFVGRPSGPCLVSKSTKNLKKSVPRSTFEKHCVQMLHKMSLGTPPTFKMMVSFIRNLHFHISTCTSKTIKHCLQWVSLWVPFLWFWGPLVVVLMD